MFGSTNEEIFIGFAVLAIIIAVYYFLNRLAKKHVNFSKRVLIALGLSIALGSITYLVLTKTDLMGSSAIANDWLYLFGYGYVDLLKMISIPIIFVSIFGAIIKLGSGKDMGKIAGTTIGVLLITTAIAATVGIVVTMLFRVDAGDIIGQDLSSVDCDLVLQVDPGTGEYVNDYSDYIRDVCEYGESRANAESSLLTFPDMLKTFIPTNMLLAFTGQSSNSTIQVVIITMFLGMAFLAVRKKNPEQGESFEKSFNTFKAIIMRVVTLVLRLTPYGVFALMFRVFAFTGWDAVEPLLLFLGASYTAIIVMFIIHGIILQLLGFNPIKYFTKGFRALAFAFTSRSSAGTLPLTIETQEKQFGIDSGVASTSASFGTSIGQNGCAGIYPAMLVTMVYATGVIPGIGISDYIMLVFITTITSLGIAGVGGGATFAAVAVFSALGLDEWLWLTGILVGIESLIDMARTSLNVSGSMVSGLVTARITNSVDMKVYNGPAVEVDSEVM